MGLDKHKKTPCGFCFVVYYTRQATEDCVTFISGTKLDDRRVRCDYDWGFQDDRQFGRGRSGGQASLLLMLLQLANPLILEHSSNQSTLLCTHSAPSRALTWGSGPVDFSQVLLILAAMLMQHVLGLLVW